VKRKPTVYWDTQAILAWLGPPNRIVKLCQAAGVQPPVASSIRMWRHRGRIPSGWVATALSLMDSKVDLRQFIIVQQRNPF